MTFKNVKLCIILMFCVKLVFLEMRFFYCFSLAVCVVDVKKTHILLRNKTIPLT